MKTILCFIAIAIACIWGWVLNIITLVSDHAIMPVTEFILRLVGVPAWPLGTIMGFFV